MMVYRIDWKVCVGALLLTGCQSAGSYLPWQASSQKHYSAEALAALDEPVPAAARPQLAENVQSPATSRVQTVSATNAPGAAPVAASRIDQLVRNGQAAIREASQGDTRKLEEAKRLFAEVLQAEPAHPSASHGLAIVADLQQDWQTAEFYYKQALRQRPQDASLLNDLGYSYLLQNRFYEASQYLNQAIQVSPQHERAHINLALLALKRGDRGGAQNQLAAIYSPSEINATLARLEQDLNRLGGAVPGSAGLASASSGPQYPTVPTAAAPTNTTAGAQPLVDAQPRHNMEIQRPSVSPQGYPVAAGPSVPVVATQLPPQTTGAPGMPVYGSGGSVPQNPATSVAVSQDKPIHVYPAGVVAENPDLAVGAQVPPEHGGPTAVYPPAAGSVPPQTTHAAGFQSGTYGVPVGGVLAAPQPRGAYDGQQGAFYGAGPGASVEPPVAGLNAGPGAIFPVQPQTAAAPNAQQYGPGPGVQQYPGNTRTIPGGTQTYPAGTALPQQQYPNPQYSAPPAQAYPPGVMNSGPAPARQYGLPVSSPGTTVSVPNATYGAARTAYSGGGYPADAQRVPGNAMQNYEQQLQIQQAGQYQQTLQQMGNTRISVPNGNYTR